MLPLFHELGHLWRAIIGIMKHPRGSVLFTLAMFALVVGTVVYHFLEGWNFLDSLYFSVTTLTTVGYGDFSPHTELGRAFSIIYIMLGIGIMIGMVEFIATYAAEEHEHEHDHIHEHTHGHTEEHSQILN